LVIGGFEIAGGFKNGGKSKILVLKIMSNFNALYASSSSSDSYGVPDMRIEEQINDMIDEMSFD